jgi:ribosomal protein S18 acetylase RimI-like enzyme
MPLVQAYYEHDGIAFDAAVVRRGLGELLANTSLGGAWLIFDGESASAIGYFVLTFGFDLEFGGRQATITELYLIPERRRSGVGRAALSFVEETLRSLGIHAFELQVESDNHAARAFYRAFGMREHARIPLSKRIAR